MIRNLIHFWVGQRLPLEHIYVGSDRKPKSLFPLVRFYLRLFFIHPLKRRIAKYYLVLLKHFTELKVIAITGSAGKTTTKEMVTSILRQKGKTVSSYANIDPIYNIPSTILKCRPTTRFLVLEMGVEYPGEMDFYLWLAKPDIAVLTNIFPTHTQFFKDTAGVFREKSKLVRSLSKSDIAVLNSDDAKVRSLKNEIKSKIILYGVDGVVKAINRKLNSNMSTTYTLIYDKNKINVHLPIVGEQFISNSLAAISVGIAADIPLSDIVKGISRYEKPKHRMEIRKLKNGATLIDDAYNNNPQAALEALKTFENLSANGKRIIVFGDMLELGKKQDDHHKDIGKKIADLDVDYLLCVGSLSEKTAVIVRKKLGKNKVDWVKSSEGVYPLLKKRITAGSFILIKGSRSIRLDKVTSLL